MNFLRRVSGNDASSSAAARQPHEILAIQGDKLDDPAYDWHELFRGRTAADGRPFRVIRAGWHELLVAAEPQASSPLLVHLAPEAARRNGGAGSCRPEVVIVRNEPTTPERNDKAALLGLHFGGCIGVNSLTSILSFTERALVQAELHRLHARLGDGFRVVPQCFFASSREMMYTMSFPAVVKVGTAHAGAGKMRVEDHHAFEDLRSVIAMSREYSTAEPFIEGDYDVRVQKVGGAVRAFRRVSVSGNWKTNTGTSMIEPLEVTPLYRAWATAAASLFGGLEILTIDAIHDREAGVERIMEVNGTSSGLMPEFAAEDNAAIRDICIDKLNAHIAAAGASAT